MDRNHLMERKLPKALQIFCQKNDIDESELTVDPKFLPRYFRVNPRFKEKLSLTQLSDELKTEVKPVHVGSYSLIYILFSI